MMKLLLKINVNQEDGSVFFDTDYEFPEVSRRNPPVEWEGGLYQDLAYALTHSGPNIRRAAKLIGTAISDPRVDYCGLHPLLESTLTDWRRAKAKELNVSAYVILTQRVLLSIADDAPTTEQALLDIPGFGPGLLARYGKEILALVASALDKEEEMPF